MASESSFSAEDAEACIQRHGFYTLKDPVVGRRVEEFRRSDFPIKSPDGLEFLAQNGFDRQDVRTLLQSTLDHPHWGFIKVYSKALPADYAFRFHNGSAEKPHTIVVQLWAPGSSVIMFAGSQKQYIEDIDKEVSKKWGLLATKRSSMIRDGIEEKPIDMEFGGLLLSDSRLGFTPVAGLVIDLGFTTLGELGFWAKMKLPNSPALRKKVEELEARGHDINYTWTAQGATQ